MYYTKQQKTKVSLLLFLKISNKINSNRISLSPFIFHVFSKDKKQKHIEVIRKTYKKKNNNFKHTYGKAVKSSVTLGISGGKDYNPSRSSKWNYNYNEATYSQWVKNSFLVDYIVNAQETELDFTLRTIRNPSNVSITKEKKS